MKSSVLGSSLAIGILLTVPAGARSGGGYPPMVGPSYPYPSYCQQCGGWPVEPQTRVVVRRPRHRTGANAVSK
jgi:hypothetical protein